MEKLTLIQTNDIHSHFENLANAMTVIDQIRTHLDEQNEEYLLIDGGDFCDRVHPLTEATDGKRNIDFLNQYGYDYATIGNNEGLGNSKQELNELYTSFNGEVLISNLIDEQTGEPPQHTKPYAIYTTKSGKKVLFFGFTALFAMSYRELGWKVIDPRIVLPKIYERFSDEVDAFVLISHLGKHRDNHLADEFPWLNLILGSHTHHLYKDGKLVKQTMLTGSEKWGHYVTVVDFDLETKHSQVKTYDIQEIHTTEAAKLEQELQEEGRQLLTDISCGQLKQSLTPVEFCQATLQALQKRYHADGAFLNTGLFLTGLQQGEVTAYDMHQALPHPMHVMEVTLAGADMKRFLYEISKNRHYLQKFHLVGMGFRGKEVGHILSVGFEEHQHEWFFNGEPLEDNRLYSFVTVDHYYFVPYFPTISYAGRTKIHMDCFLRREVAGLINDLGE